MLWGVRLTYNFARKGGYKPGGEDYRWVESPERRSAPRWFQVLNATFLAPLQNYPLAGDRAALVRGVSARSGHAARSRSTMRPLWRFLRCSSWARPSRTSSSGDSRRRSTRRSVVGKLPSADFITSGLFRYSRHPNFFCEQAMWWVYYVFSVAAGAGWLNWTIVGAQR